VEEKLKEKKPLRISLRKSKKNKDPTEKEKLQTQITSDYDAAFQLGVIADVNEDSVKELTAMGFSRELVIQALQAYPNDKDGAVNYLLVITNKS